MGETLDNHRRIWLSKPVLRAVYQDCYRRIVNRCVPGGRCLEIGGGTGNLKAFLPAITTTDIQFASWLDVVADAHRLPFRTRSFRNIVLFDVLHHLERPGIFLKEASWLLEPGGRIVICEPAITPFSYFFYRFLHHEPTLLHAEPLDEGALSRERNPYDSNQAIATLLFGRDRAKLSLTIPTLEIVSTEFFSFLAYPLSGGFQRWSALPASLAPPLLKLESRLEHLLGQFFAFRLLGVIERRRPTPAQTHIPPKGAVNPDHSKRSCVA